MTDPHCPLCHGAGYVPAAEVAKARLAAHHQALGYAVNTCLGLATKVEKAMMVDVAYVNGAKACGEAILTLMDTKEDPLDTMARLGQEFDAPTEESDQ
ncbi:MAG: hypothetical protein KAT58_02720 [candidate division Zixibacteria bacterium]|nr:hypothetical protein [candidate division Zixibacteria bacterium]